MFRIVPVPVAGMGIFCAQGVFPFVQGFRPFLQGSFPSLQGSPSFPQGSLSAPQGFPPFPQGSSVSARFSPVSARFKLNYFNRSRNPTFKKPPKPKLGWHDLNYNPLLISSIIRTISAVSSRETAPSPVSKNATICSTNPA